MKFWTSGLAEAPSPIARSAAFRSSAGCSGQQRVAQLAAALEKRPQVLELGAHLAVAMLILCEPEEGLRITVGGSTLH